MWPYFVIRTPIQKLFILDRFYLENIMQLFAEVQFNICRITKSRKEFRVPDFQTTGAASQVFLKIATPNILENNNGEQL